MAKFPTYVLITAARDEAKFIELTLKSVAAQTVPPVRWVIVSDGSTDGTDEIIKTYAAIHPWIEFIRMPERRDRHFAGKANAVNAAYARIRHLQFQAIVNLDGDVSFEESYFSYLLGKLDEDPALGLIGTAFRGPNHRPYDYRFASDENVPGPCQVFRRECFEEIGGYAPMEHGGVDHCALVSARMKGWKTRAFIERTFCHQRPMGSAQYGTLSANFSYGLKDYRIGNHPAWELLRVIYRVFSKPIVLGGLLLGAGYLWAAVRRVKRQIPDEMIQFHRREQFRRLKRLVTHLGTSTADARTTEATRARSDHDPAPDWTILDLPTYVLITPARNEAQFIESTIKSVVGQTVRPLRWVIVSDGSTDGTDDIVKRYSRDHHWIELMRMPERGKRNFSGKACAVNAAYASVRNLEFQVIVSLDGDISLSRDHFAYLLSQLAQNPALGVVGTPFQEVTGETYDYRFVSIEHVSGACQVFRRQCFEAISGYMPIAGGGVDQTAVISARMRGWKTMTFTGMMCLHHRKMGTADHGEYAAWFRTGMKDYRLGGHPLWELGRVVFRINKKPLIVGSLLLGAGYFWALVRRVKRPLPRELEAFHREEQMRRLKKFFTRKRVPGVEKLQRPA